ncbi:hypothetical protein J437_LFUL011793 [Ladona fulva]|uniref:Uncharacterized protein n=1 Tax=Ladona fulva TaxID=123851 RepID=A0A8K0KC85_LADFU|nr:hypothetical protein J437_LFUL011793 [Ladona fulva]
MSEQFYLFNQQAVFETDQPLVLPCSLPDYWSAFTTSRRTRITVRARKGRKRILRKFFRHRT